MLGELRQGHSPEHREDVSPDVELVAEERGRLAAGLDTLAQPALEELAERQTIARDRQALVTSLQDLAELPIRLPLCVEAETPTPAVRESD